VDPGHAWKHGVSFRVGAARDVYLEQVKDVSIALYSRDVAARVRDRIDSLGPFDSLTAAQLQSLATRFDLDYVVGEIAPPEGRPAWSEVGREVWRNSRFFVRDLTTSARD
jgi:hypothetical protein